MSFISFFFPVLAIITGKKSLNNNIQVKNSLLDKMKNRHQLILWWLNITCKKKKRERDKEIEIVFEGLWIFMKKLATFRVIILCFFFFFEYRSIQNNLVVLVIFSYFC